MPSNQNKITLKGGRLNLSSKWFALILLSLLVVTSGCETVKGLKKDMDQTWTNLKEWDKNFKENWW